MNPIFISSLGQIPGPAQDALLEKAREIFFETSSRTIFVSKEDRAKFQHRYFDVYLESPDFFYLARTEDAVLGYLAGAPLTLSQHYAFHPYLERFRSEIEECFPAHLHINLTGSARGTGTGSKLIERFENDLMLRGSRGLHIVTSIDARNVSFYERNGLIKASVTEWNQKNLFLMGKKFPLQPASV